MTVASVKCGTTTGYKQGCRCEPCREAQSLYAHRYRLGLRRKKGRAFKPIQHGTANAYVKRKCRCRECVLYWREYTRAQKRRLRGSTREHTAHSICVTCGKSFAAAGRNLYCSNKCGAKAWRDKRRQLKSYTAVLPDDLRVRWQRQRVEEIAAAAKQNDELAELIAQQEKDARVGDFISHRMQSLDAQLFEDGAERYELIGSDDLDPAAILEQAEFAVLLNEVIGGRTEEDIRRLDYHTQEHLAGKLRDAGLASIPVTRAERTRLREPEAKSGTKVAASKSFGGKTKRREKVGANRHGRPAQKPPKRWTRQSWYEDVAA